jgi:hypothetical protein
LSSGRASIVDHVRTLAGTESLQPAE